MKTRPSLSYTLALSGLILALNIAGCMAPNEPKVASQESPSSALDEPEVSWSFDAGEPMDEGSPPRSPDGAVESRERSEDSQESGKDNTWWEACPIDGLEERLMNVGDVTLNVACRGSGPTIVFLHGFPEFHYGWHQVMNELATDYRLVAPDQRGYNLSDKPADIEAYELPKLAMDIVQLLPLVSEEPVILVAHDWGGPVGWMVAHTPDAHLRGFVSTNGPHPVRFSNLIANDPAQKEASSYMEVFKAETAELFLTVESLSAMLADVLDEDTLSLYIDAWEQPGAVTGGLNWYRANSLEPAEVEKVMSPLSPTIPVPVVVMWGEADEFVLSSNADELEPFAPELEVFLYPDVDHWIAHRIPKEVATILRNIDQKTGGNR